MYSNNTKLKNKKEVSYSLKPIGTSNNDIMIKDKDKLHLGDCTCVIRNKDTGKTRLANGSVARIPYTKYATKEDRKKYGKNLVYVIYYNSEDVIGYYQPNKKKGVKNEKIF